jgi:hypothetical protein
VITKEFAWRSGVTSKARMAIVWRMIPKSSDIRLAWALDEVHRNSPEK